MKEIRLEEMRRIQMDMLDVIHEFCKNNNIRYSMAGGTMLGAVRHKGYIPWDDDIDIQMLRDDYERFETIFPDKVGDFVFRSLKRDKTWHANFAKLCDSRTICIENEIERGVGISIDIFPIDDCPDNQKEWKTVYNKLKILHYVKTLKLTHLRKGRSLAKNVLLGILKFPLLFTPRSLWLKWYERFCRQFNNKGYHSAFEFSCGPGFSTPHPKSLYDDIIEWPFEDRRYMGFRDADKYLSLSYGDYMQLPPEEKRTFKHNFELYWKE